LPKLTYELLFALVDAAPALLTHDEVADRVWRGRLVTPETISQRVLLLRRALGDHADSPRYLRVVRGLGWQLIPPVRMRLPASPSMAAGLLEAGARAAASIDLSLPAQPSIVVLPFDTDDDAGHRNIALG